MKAPYRVRKFFRKKYSGRDNTTGLMYLAEMPMQQQTNITRNRSTKICTIPRFVFILREMQREFNMNRPLESRFHTDYSTNYHLGPRIMSKLWRHACTQSKEEGTRKKEQVKDRSCPEGVEVMVVRDLPFKTYRGRSIVNLEARDEAKKQKTQENKKSDQTHRDTTRLSHFYWQ